jgi:hypothetical protein
MQRVVYGPSVCLLMLAGIAWNRPQIKNKGVDNEVSLPVTGHLNPMTTLARKLQSRGHEVLFYRGSRC